MQDKINQLLSHSGPSSAVPPAISAAPITPAPETVTAAAPAPAANQVDVSEPVSHALGPVQFRGYSDVDYGRAWFEKLPSGGLKGSTNSFNIGDFDLFVNTKISEHWSVLGEMLVTSDFTNTFGVEIDRLLFSFRPSERFNIAFGKFDTALGYYPGEFHRATYFQSTTGRPVMYSDEDNGGILPIHSVGLTATGLLPSGKLGLHWVAEVANGRTFTGESPIQNFVDDGNGKAVNLALYVKPEGLRGFQAGFSVYRDNLHQDGVAIGETIVTGHVVYAGSKLELLNEASILRHKIDGTSLLYTSVTGYTQASYRFGKLRPFFRYDYQNTPASDPLYGTFGRTNGPSFGINRHLSNYVVFKLQYGWLEQRGRPSANDLQSQLAFAF